VTRTFLIATVCVAGLAAGDPAAPAQQARRYRTLEDRMEAPRFASLEAWRRRAAYLREHVLASAGLLPMPEKTPLQPVVFGDVRHEDYTVSKVYFESLPGVFVTGNLYRPPGNGPFPAILSPHGHWYYGRLENSETASVPGRAINQARQGFVVFTYDMVGYNDSRQLPHNPHHTGHARAFGGRRESLWGLSLAGLQLWNSIRSIDFLESLPYVARDRIGATGASGGGTQTFLVAAVDERIAAAAPVNMISLLMQGGCLCENMPGLRVETNNVEIAALIAPRPLLMVSATGDWTKETLELEYPAMQTFYALFGAKERVHAVRFEAEHNYNRDSREAVYAWMARWLQNAPADVRRVEQSFRPDPLPDLLVFHQRPIPAHAVTAEQLTEYWIDAAKRQFAASPPAMRRNALRHALGFAHEQTGDVQSDDAGAAARATQGSSGSTEQRVEATRGRTERGGRGDSTVLLADAGAELEKLLRKEGVAVRTVPWTPFDAEAASKVSHFEGYNRTQASQRVADVVAALRAQPRAALVAGGDAALAALLAAAIAPARIAILDVGDFDASSDDAFLDRLYIPGLRRAGDFQTAAGMARGDIVIHNAAPSFQIPGVRVERRALSARDILALLKNRPIPSASPGAAAVRE
jgi:hypothetical protein